MGKEQHIHSHNRPDSRWMGRIILMLLLSAVLSHSQPAFEEERLADPDSAQPLSTVRTSSTHFVVRSWIPVNFGLRQCGLEA